MTKQRAMKNSTIFIIISAVLVGTALLYFLSGGQQKNKFNWSPTLNQDKKEPYDFSILQELLSETYSWERIEKGSNAAILDTVNAEGSAYIFVGQQPFYTDKTVESLFKFAEKGGELIFISESLPDSVLLLLKEYSVSSDLLWFNSIQSEKIISSFSKEEHQSKKFPFSFKSGANDSSEYYWSHFPEYPKNSSHSYGSFILNESTDKHFTNFIGFRIGNGHFYWHCNPLLFTNLYLSKNNLSGFEHLNAFLSHFNAKKWFWDHGSTYGPKESPSSNINTASKPKTPLEYIFAQPALTFSWLILVAMAILYALFAAKRRQQQIPIVEPNRNNSMEFVKTIGRLYFQQQNHKVIFEKIMQLFRSHLRRRYGVHLSDDDLADDNKVQIAIKRTDIKENIIRDIFSAYLELKSKLSNNYIEMSAETLHRFYLLVNKFYEAEKARKSIKSSSKTKI
jgi:hypothetical protein